MRLLQSGDVELFPRIYPGIGKPLRTANGPLAGMEGIQRRQKRSYLVILSVDVIRRSIVAEAGAADLLPQQLLLNRVAPNELFPRHGQIAGLQAGGSH